MIKLGFLNLHPGWRRLETHTHTQRTVPTLSLWSWTSSEPFILPGTHHYISIVTPLSPSWAANKTSLLKLLTFLPYLQSACFTENGSHQKKIFTPPAILILAHNSHILFLSFIIIELSVLCSRLCPLLMHWFPSHLACWKALIQQFSFLSASFLSLFISLVTQCRNVL